MFGVDLTAFVRSRRTTRPFVVDKCVQEIEARGLLIEGIYRISGFADEMDSLRMALEKGNGAHVLNLEFSSYQWNFNQENISTYRYLQ